MQPTLIHYCQVCSTTSEIPITASVFSQLNHCASCGHIAGGINQPPSTTQHIDNTMAMYSQQQQDELAQLFASSLNFSKPITPPPEPVEQQKQVPIVEPICVPHPSVQTYASQHYTPTRHVLPMRFSTPPDVEQSPTRFYNEDGELEIITPTPPPQQEEQQPQVRQQYEEEQPQGLHPLHMATINNTVKHHTSDEELIDLLQQNGIDHTQLFPSQVNLFRNALPDQRNRLLMLWRISPPNQGAFNIPQEQSSWMETSFETEETTAGLRYEEGERRKSQEIALQQQHSQAQLQLQSQNQHQHMRSTSISEGLSRGAEPYMMSGYEMLASKEYQAAETRSSSAPIEGKTPVYTQATDPAWQKETMANGYGAFQAAREAEACTWQRNGLDEDMIM